MIVKNVRLKIWVDKSYESHKICSTTEVTVEIRVNHVNNTIVIIFIIITVRPQKYNNNCIRQFFFRCDMLNINID